MLLHDDDDDKFSGWLAKCLVLTRTGSMKRISIAHKLEILHCEKN